jgi:hypothetical protein
MVQNLFLKQVHNLENLLVVISCYLKIEDISYYIKTNFFIYMIYIKVKQKMNYWVCH